MTKSRVLVVDDEEGILRSMEQYFRQRGDDCHTARNARDALQVAQDRIFDLVLSDISMPGMDGLELIRRLKQIQPQVVCILMSGLGTRRDIIMALQIGVFDFVDKPIPDIETFNMVIERAAERSRLVRERDALLETLKEQNSKLEFSLYQLHEAFGQLRKQEEILRSDLAKAQRTQRQFLPTAFPQSERLNVFGYYAPCELLGGDFFGHMTAKDGRVAIYLADVAGHGVSAAMFTVTLHELIRTHLRRSTSQVFDAPEQLLTLMNEALAAEEQDASFLATMVFAVFDPATGRVRIATAGHPAPLLVGADRESVPVDVSGPVLGAQISAPFKPAELQLQPGDALLFFSDGLTEARDAEGAEFTQDRLRSTLATLRERPAAEIGGTIEYEIREHLDGLAPNDDLTFIVVTCPLPTAAQPAEGEPTPTGEAAAAESVKIVTWGSLARARTDSRGQIRGGWLGRDCIIRCSGTMTWQHAPALRDLVSAAKAKNSASIAIHLAECQSLDSTMLGLLLKISDDVVLHQPTDRVVGQLDEMGLLPKFTISHDPCPLPEVEMEPVATEGAESCSDLILSAHEALMEVSASNRQRFKDVVESLRHEQAQPKGEAKGGKT